MKRNTKTYSRGPKVSSVRARDSRDTFVRIVGSMYRVNPDRR